MTAGPRRRLRLQLRGIVQGVGFRPFVYHLACELGIGGYVLNTSSGLVIEAEAPPGILDEFRRRVQSDAPPLAWIQDLATDEIPAGGESDFSIRESIAETGEFALISPDVASCAACIRDFTDPSNRRAGYAFTNCTNCGPRYSIILDIPYDRPNTTMAGFAMCPDCRSEYDDPRNRRFHAQPNACPVCGPALSAPAEEARRRLAAGEILAIKGLGGFQLACDARNAAAVESLRRRKKRSDKPFALMVRDLETAESLCTVSEEDRRALTGSRRPIVVMRARVLLPGVAPNNHLLGIMLPYTPLHHLLFADAAYDCLVMTSGNLSEEPIVVENGEARDRLGGVADWFLTHNRDIFMRVDDSVVRTFENRERLLRRARGYAPETLDLGRGVPEMLACGGELKNAFCLTKGRHAILSQHIGDLENYETLVFFEETLANLKKLFRVTPRMVVHDLHPQYLSTRYALGLDLPRVGVQHHHAHIASCMAENRLEGDVIGVAFDGTGYGLDGAIWGGEFFTGGYAGFERRAHFRYVPMAGGDAAVRQPWRMALAYALDAGVEFESGFQGGAIVRRMIASGFHTVPTSSCGRLFDAVASLIGLRHEVNYEGQAAIELEQIADTSVEDAYPFAFDGDTLDFRPAIEQIVNSTESAPVVAARFHNTIASVIVETCSRLRRQTGLTRVCLSGGTFQNVLLLDRAVPALRRAGFVVFLHARVPPNDGGIALGQAAIAASRY